MPETETFGWLIILSFLFVCFGALFYICYSAKFKVKPEPQQTIGPNENKYEFEEDEED